jgi:hypothetical protein
LGGDDVSASRQLNNFFSLAKQAVFIIIIIVTIQITLALVSYFGNIVASHKPTQSSIPARGPKVNEVSQLFPVEIPTCSHNFHSILRHINPFENRRKIHDSFGVTFLAPVSWFNRCPNPQQKTF